jgi:hypothetical protein
LHFQDQFKLLLSEIDIQGDIYLYEGQVQEMEIRLNQYKKSLGKAADLPPKSILEEQLKFTTAAFRKRKRTCDRIINHMMQDERGVYTRDQLLEAIGIEQDS